MGLIAPRRTESEYRLYTDRGRALDRAVVSIIEAGLAAPRIPSWVPEVIRHMVARSGWRDWGSAIWQRDRADGTLKAVSPAVAEDSACLPFQPPTSGSKGGGRGRFSVREVSVG